MSLWINNAEREAVRARYHVGDIVTYVGRLDSYDDIWRTLYLVNGSVLAPAPPVQDHGSLKDLDRRWNNCENLRAPKCAAWRSSMRVD